MKSPHRLNRWSRKRARMAVKHNHLPWPMSAAEMLYMAIIVTQEDWFQQMRESWSTLTDILSDEELLNGEDAHN